MKKTIPGKICLLVVLLFIAGSCSQDDGFECLKSTGEIKRENRYVSPFHYIEVHDNINLILTQDTLVNSIEVEAGENLLSGIRTSSEKGHLVIQNENRCDWLRRFDVPVNVYITFSSLDSLVFRAAGDLSFTTPWQNDSIQFDVWEGAGRIDIRLEVFKSRIYVHYGVASVMLSGYSQVSYISNKGYGPVDALGLETKFTYMSTQSPNDCFISVINELGVSILNIGNVFYKGDPSSIDLETTSSGKLIRLE